MQILYDLKQDFTLLINNFSNVNINLYILVTVAALFLILHKLRHLPILSQVSICLSFFPVLVHELGHAFASQIIGGQVDDIRMMLTQKQQQKSGKQGYATTRAKNKFQFAFITFFGYVAPPLMLFTGIYFVFKDITFVFLFICIVFLVFYLVMTKQKWIPLILIILVGYACYNIVLQHYSIVTQSTSLIYNILLGLLLGETIQSMIITTQTTFIHKTEEWDGAAMRKLTLIPVTFWWLIWVLISLILIYKSFALIL